MATKIRLARHGHKDYAFYHIVVADSPARRVTAKSSSVSVRSIPTPILQQ